MKKIFFLILIILSSIIVNSQNIYFIDVNGDDTNLGTFTEPWGTWNKGFRNVKPGDTLYIRGGTYYSTERIGMQGWTAPRWFYGPVDNPWHPIGTQDSGIVIMGYPPDIQQGNYPILDCSQHCQNMHLLRVGRYDPKIGKTTRLHSPYNPRYNSAITLIDVEYVTLKDFKIRNVYQCDGILQGALTVIGSNVTYDNISIDNASLGFWHISTSYTEEDSTYIRDAQLWMNSREYHALMTIVQARTKNRPLIGADTLLNAFWLDSVHHRPPDTSRWINCDVSNICDTLSFTQHDLYYYYIFEGDTLYSMRLYSNFNDFITPSTGKFGDAWKIQSFSGNYYSFEGCRAWNYSGDGFDVRGGKRSFENCWAMPSFQYEHLNKSDGFVTSAFQSGLIAYYNEAYRDSILEDTTVKFTNCFVAFASGRAFRHGIDSDVDDNPLYYNNTVYMSTTAYMLEIASNDTIGYYYNNLEFNTDTAVLSFPTLNGTHNSWNASITPTSSDFISLDSLTIINLFTAARDSTGNLPDDLPLALAVGSNLIDVGINVGLEFNGYAPDIGYSESNYDDGLNQNIPLAEGWNIASFYVRPSVIDMLDVVDPLILNSTLEKSMDEAGGFVQNIEPYGWLNTIGDMHNTEGYYFNVNQNTSLNVSGTQINLPYDIPLQAGWNIISYPINVNRLALTALQPLIDDSVLIKVLNEAGDFIQYIEGYGWLNTIGTLEPNEGYHVKVSADDTLTYYPGTKSSIPMLMDRQVIPNTTCFPNFETNPFMPMNVLVDKKIKTRGFKSEIGDEIGVYDGDVYVGGTVITDVEWYHNIVARMDDPLTPEKDGFTPGNPILFRYCDKSEDKIYMQVDSRHYWGEELFTSFGTTIKQIRVKAKKNNKKIVVTTPKEVKPKVIIEKYTLLKDNYPNPFKDNTTIEYDINKAGHVSLAIYDLLGRKIETLYDGNNEEGTHIINYNTSLDPGMYFYRLTFTSNNIVETQTKKFIILP